MWPEVHKILDAIKARADYVILDSPPLLAVTDARLLADQADATVVVVERGKTRSEAFQRACESLGQTNAKIIGVVLNKLKARHRAYYSYAYSPKGMDSRKRELTPAQDDGRGAERASADQVAGR